jgi:hypothetical protein
MNTIQNEFEIVVRNQSININSHSYLTTDTTNIQRRYSMDTSLLSPIQSTNNTVVKSNSTSAYSFHQPSTITEEENTSTTVRKLF